MIIRMNKLMENELMKIKNFIVLILLFSLVFGGCGAKEVTNYQNPSQTVDEDIVIKETFEDDIFKDYISEYVDEDKDGILSEEEINKVSKININGFADNRYKELKSVKGIELFPELKELTCYGCSLSEIDVSSNSKLKSLVVGYTKIGQLDISHNKELVELDCSSTDVDKIDLNDNLLLEDIDICDTNISVINLKDLKELKHFDCIETLIADIDVTHNTKLEGMAIDNTAISELDLSQNANLKMITCTDTRNLHSLDLSNNPKMESIYCQRSGIKELDLSNNPEMFEVECDEGTVIVGGDNLSFLQRFPDED